MALSERATYEKCFWRAKNLGQKASQSSWQVKFLVSLGKNEKLRFQNNIVLSCVFLL